LGWCQGDGQLVVEASVSVTQHLVFVHDEEARPVALNEAVLLGLQRGHQHGRAQILRQVARGNAYVPASGTPLGQLVIGQRTSRYSVNGLAAILALVGPDLEDERLTGSGGGLDDYVLALAQGADGLLLPEVGNRHLVEGGQVGQG
jgi:hypothetical protein